MTRPFKKHLDISEEDFEDLQVFKGCGKTSKSFGINNKGNRFRCIRYASIYLLNQYLILIAFHLCGRSPLGIIISNYFTIFLELVASW